MPRRSVLARALGVLCMLLLLAGVALSRMSDAGSAAASVPPEAAAAATASSATASSPSTASAAVSSTSGTAATTGSASAANDASAAESAVATSAATIGAVSSAAASAPVGSVAPASTRIGSPYGPLPGGPCHLRQAAFCDTFAEGAHQGGAPNRNGALDPARWSVARLTETENAGQGQLFAFPPTSAMFCQTPISGVLPDADSFMCDGTDGKTTILRGTEDMHWMSAIDDGGSYATLGARALQPFDFAGRTGTIAFAVDLVTRGPHSWWPSLMVSDQPLALAHPAKPGVNSPPRNGFDIDFDAGCGQPAADASEGTAGDFPATTVGQVAVFSDYREQDLKLPARGDAACVLTSRDQHNHVIVQVSQTSLDVYANDYTDASHTKLRLILHVDQSSGFALGFARGYVSLEHSQYNAAKFDGESAHTYHWHTVGFDGPVLPAVRAYQVPDALTPATLELEGGSVVGRNIGYAAQGASKAITIDGVDPRGASAAYVTFDWREDAQGDPGLQVRLNGGPWRNAVVPPGLGSFVATNAIAPIPLADLRAGANTLEINAPRGAAVANIDLVLDPAGASQPAAAPNRAGASAGAVSASATASTSTAAPAQAPARATAPSPSPTPLRKRVLADCVSTDGGKTWRCTPAP